MGNSSSAPKALKVFIAANFGEGVAVPILMQYYG